jgi:hypothetical protein
VELFVYFPLYAFTACTWTLYLLPSWCSGNSIDLYSGDDQFEYPLEPRLSWPTVFMFLTVPPDKFCLVPRVYHDSFLLNLFQFIFHQSLYGRRYMGLVWETDGMSTLTKLKSHGPSEKGSTVISVRRFERKVSLWKGVNGRIILRWILIKVLNNYILSTVCWAWNVFSHPEGRSKVEGGTCLRTEGRRE